MTDLANQTRHYAAVRARLMQPVAKPPNAAPRFKIIITRPELHKPAAAPPLPAPPQDPKPDVKTPEWRTPTVVPVFADDRERIAFVLKSLPVGCWIFDKAAVPVSVPDIKAAVADTFGVPIAAIDGRSRTSDIARVRAIAMAMARLLSGQSLHRLGKAFGRDHSVISYVSSKYGDLVLEQMNALSMSQTPVKWRRATRCRRWTDADRSELARLWASPLRPTVIAGVLNRSVISVQQKAHKMRFKRPANCPGPHDRNWRVVEEEIENGTNERCEGSAPSQAQG